MGAELPCRVRCGDRMGTGTAYLETTELRFRGDFPLKIALADMRSVKATDGDLIVATAAGETRFTLGPAADNWARKILNPKPRIEKLGVKAAARVAVLGVDDAAFRAELAARKVEILRKTKAGSADIVFVAADSAAELRRLGTLRAMLAPGGAIWVVSRKGKEATVKDFDVIAAGRKAGLADNKVVAFSETHTALRFSVPKAERSG